ncbi:hypothetical protein LTR70_007967 [Exophiala xenobiotica]|uniref:Glycoside hydrolase family 43 protein n=1 Tax=Lithohypha guttulata TaxID=1690604 RepID=A0ABR0K1R7_9EURO|nr:hypothetical protein LTR24_007813 [Lithohypha guttulata]KAK5312801.1 hypothetical protein LTR70_007967 [Exophiala xenobiotica]
MHSITLLLTVLAFNVWVSSSQAQYNTTYGTIQPVLSVDFADPSIIEVNGNWFAFATSGNGHNIQVAVSPGFTNHEWRLMNETDVLPDPGRWAINDQRVWAPDVIQTEDGRWVMYYAAPALNDSSKHCVGAATSTSIVGPYSPSDEPLACPLEEGGAIDAAGFLDPKSGNLYVVYKIDGNTMNAGGGPCNGNPGPDGYLHPTPIMLQQVSKADGISKIGDPIQILDRSDADGPLVEAPSLFYNNEFSLYFLTFSSNCYSTDLYDIGFAYSTCLDTEFVKSKYPLMTTQSIGVFGPGGADMTDDGKYALYHGTVDRTENGEPIRYMYAAEAGQAGLDMSALPIF